MRHPPYTIDTTPLSARVILTVLAAALALLAVVPLPRAAGQEELFVDFSGLPVGFSGVAANALGYQFTNPSASTFQLTRARVLLGIDFGGVGNVRIVEFTSPLGVAPTAGNTLALIPMAFAALPGVPAFPADAVDVAVPAGVVLQPGQVYGVVLEALGLIVRIGTLGDSSAVVFTPVGAGGPAYGVISPFDGPFQLFGILAGGAVVVPLVAPSPRPQTSSPWPALSTSPSRPPRRISRQS